MKKRLTISLMTALVVMLISTNLFARIDTRSNKIIDSSQATATGKSPHEELVDLFFAWRKFHTPKMKNGVPDYSKESMNLQHRELAGWQSRLAAIDTTGWPISHQVDWYLLWAEMNGLDFSHRVHRPWERDPAFYVWFFPSATDVPAREGPHVHGIIELSQYSRPLSSADAAEITLRLKKAPLVFEQAMKNLTGNARDLWITGARSIRDQSRSLGRFARSMAEGYPALAGAAEEAGEASGKFADWLDQRGVLKTGNSGVGKTNHSWYLKKVHLLPYTWEDEESLLLRELARAHSALRLEEHRNRNHPMLSKIDNAGDYDRLLNEAVTEYMDFLTEKEILPIKDYMDAALRARMGRFSPSDGLRGFFSEITYRDPIVMRTHHYHWFDLARMEYEPNESPIRRTPLLYNIYDNRAEGMATGMEEMMMHAGLLDKRPRARELVWILLAQRCARGLGGLYQHGLEMNFDEATKFASKWTPRGLLPADGGTIQHEEQFYLEQPGYGTSYVIGKIDIEKLIAEYSRQREGRFVLKEFMDDFNMAGVIPISLVYWQLTGDKSMLNAALED